MPDYRGAVIANDRETDVCVGSLDEVVQWAEWMIGTMGASAIRISKVDKEDKP